MNQPDDISVWSAGLTSHHLPRWAELPDIELYLDQVLTLLNKYLEPFAAEAADHTITASMINNYVKLRIVPAPVKKRYARTQLAYLIVIGLLKPVLPIPDIKLLLESQFDGLPDEAVRAQAFDRFCAMQEEAFAQMAQQTAELLCGTQAPPVLAMKMAAQANACKALSEKLIALQKEM